MHQNIFLILLELFKDKEIIGLFAAFVLKEKRYILVMKMDLYAHLIIIMNSSLP
jgi:hypothetical protein